MFADPAVDAVFAIRGGYGSAQLLDRIDYDLLRKNPKIFLGYSDITPVGQPAYSLTWLEVLFGQFYMAVVVAQMVGLKIAQALRGRGQDST